MDGLSDLLRDPAHVAKIPLETIPALLCQLAALQSALAARLLGETAPVGGPEPEADALLEVTEAARRLGTTRDWLYRHAHQLPFTVRMGPR